MTVQKDMYVVARNASGRATLEHKLVEGFQRTGCGTDISAWSCYYTHVRIEAILCLRRGCRG